MRGHVRPMVYDRLRGQIFMSLGALDSSAGLPCPTPLAGFGWKKKEGGGAGSSVEVEVTAPAHEGPKLRMVAGRVRGSGQLCVVILRGHGMRPCHFRRGMVIECAGLEPDRGIYVFAGVAPSPSPVA